MYLYLCILYNLVFFMNYSKSLVLSKSLQRTHTTHIYKQVLELYSSFSQLYLIRICYFTLFSCTHSHCLFTHHLLQFILLITLSNDKKFVSGFVSAFVSSFVSGQAFLTLPTLFISVLHPCFTSPYCYPKKY